nr:MAG TPA: hypothetical protein [Caudoviricetes sp.]
MSSPLGQRKPLSYIFITITHATTEIWLFLFD